MCDVVGVKCCTDIPHNSEHIDSLAAKIKAEGEKYHNYNPNVLGLVSWLKGVFGS